MKRIDQLKEMFEQDKEDPFLHYALAKEFEYTGEDALALETFQSLMKKHPDYVGLYYHYGKLLEKLNQADQALYIYAIGIETAKKLSDFFALGELQTAKTNLEIEL